MAGSIDESLHAIFLPYMAPGHMMPLVDIARLFAAHDNIKVTIITTPMNARRFNTALDRQTKVGNPITVKILPFPTVEAGLPQGWENLIDAPTPDITMKLFHAIEMLHPEIEKLIRSLGPGCIVSDVLFHWTSDLALELGVPRLAFSGSGFFNLSVAYCVEHYQPHKAIESETQPFVVPTLPDRVVLTKSQLPDIVKTRNKFSELFDKLKEADRKCFGMLVNSFYELESAYADYYKNIVGIKAWHVGPASFFWKDEADKVERGEKACISKHSCLAWLDSKKTNSVLYICFGSLTRFSKAQLMEIASAVESAGHCFVWVVGKLLETEKVDNMEENEKWWLPEGFEERLRKSGKGMIIRGWAPQLLILEHEAIGAFMTHCGWNSILEGSTAGVPMITWPMFAEQFYNEKLVTQVLKFGIPVGNKFWKAWATEDRELVRKEKIDKAVKKIMSDDEDAREMRKTVEGLSKLAKKAVEEGGSSAKDLKVLIEEIRQYVKK